jgi:hypothetical protein
VWVEVQAPARCYVIHCSRPQKTAAAARLVRLGPQCQLKTHQQLGSGRRETAGCEYPLWISLS